MNSDAVVEPETTYVTGTGFLSHGYTTLRLKPGEYLAQVRVISGERTWCTTEFRLRTPDRGLYGFVVSDTNRPQGEALPDVGTRSHSRDDVLLRLAELRSSGVRLRNEGIRLEDGAMIGTWIEETYRWHEVVKSEIIRLSPAEAQIYETLDWVQAPDFPNALTDQHRFYLRVVSHRISNLKGLVIRYLDSGKG